MAEYKVIQDIEAEDKLLGPLTLRQFVYAGIVAASLFIAFQLAKIAWWLAIPMLPHMILFGLLAAPFGKDQNSEIWLLAKIRFMLKPQIRIWDQSNVKQLVTITAPKRIEHQLTDNLSQIEVKSRLRALADTLDSRGWAVKNLGAFTQPTFAYAQSSPERLVAFNAAQLPPVNDFGGAKNTNDMLDPQTSSTAQNIDRLMAQSSAAHRKHAIDSMHQPPPPPAPKSTTPAQNQGPPAQSAPAPDFWFMNQPDPSNTQPGYATFPNNPAASVQPAAGTQSPYPPAPSVPVAANPTEEEKALIAHLAERNEQINPMHSHLKTIQPLSATDHTSMPMPPLTDPANDPVVSVTPDPEPPAPQEPATPEPPVTPQPDPDIIGLASNDDLNVATIARQAQKKKRKQPDEVVITLH